MKIDHTMSDDVRKRIPYWGFLVHEVARMLKRRFEEEARTYGLTLPQWRALGRISMGGENSQAALAAALDTDPMTMSGILDRLEKRDLIVRSPDPHDSRAKLAELTPEGAALVQRARNVGRTVFENALEGIPASDRESLIRSLSCIRDNLGSETVSTEDLQQ
jgi:DNA-binding MarR family transcriptional regulator